MSKLLWNVTTAPKILFCDHYVYIIWHITQWLHLVSENVKLLTWVSIIVIKQENWRESVLPEKKKHTSYSCVTERCNANTEAGQVFSMRAPCGAVYTDISLLFFLYLVVIIQLLWTCGICVRFWDMVKKNAACFDDVDNIWHVVLFSEISAAM